VVKYYNHALFLLFYNFQYGVYPFNSSLNSTVSFSFNVDESSSSITVQNSTVNFLPTGEPEDSFTDLSNPLQPDDVLTPDISFWTALNWMFVVWFWVSLYDFGQVSGRFASAFPDDIYELVWANSSRNIFLNETLLESYTSVLNNIILPYVTFNLVDNPNHPIIPLSLNETNRLQGSPTSLLQTYSCTQRQPKEALSLIVSVLAADYALAHGAYSLFIFVTGWWQRRKDNLGKAIFLDFLMN
jgi:hypothetical protein